MDYPALSWNDAAGRGGCWMNRRTLLRTLASSALSSTFLSSGHARAQSRAFSRVRPGDPAWPSQADWDRLNRDVGGQLVHVQSPLAACVANPQSAPCADVFKLLKNPYAVGDDVALTENLGWVDAWSSQPSACAVTARNTRDIAAAVNFARARNLRLDLKGGGHSYRARQIRRT